VDRRLLGPAVTWANSPQGNSPGRGGRDEGYYGRGTNVGVEVNPITQDHRGHIKITHGNLSGKGNGSLFLAAKGA